MTPLVRVMTSSAGSLSTLKLLTVVEAIDPKCVVTKFSNLWKCSTPLGHWLAFVLKQQQKDVLHYSRLAITNLNITNFRFNEHCMPTIWHPEPKEQCSSYAFQSEGACGIVNRRGEVHTG